MPMRSEQNNQQQQQQQQGQRESERRSGQTKSEISKARWDILRAALMTATRGDKDTSENGSNNDNDEGNKSAQSTNNASIHRFPGWNLLKKEQYTNPWTKDQNENNTVDHVIVCQSHRIEAKILALQSCLSHHQDNHVKQQEQVLLRLGKRSANQDESDDGVKKDIQKVRERLASHGISCSPLKPNSQLLVRYRPTCNYHCVRFSYSNPQLQPSQSHQQQQQQQQQPDLLSLRIRERTRSVAAHKVTLAELLSHRRTGIDNTGQTCVWDSESTLAFVLLRQISNRLSNTNNRLQPILNDILFSNDPTSSSPHQHQQQQPLNVVELGAGMAGLAGMALTKVLLSQSKRRVRLLLTDGHPQAVLNNQINLALNDDVFQQYDDEEGHGDGSKVLTSCERLVWDAGIGKCPSIQQQHASQFHLALASDCTHFQEHHAALVVTLAYLLHVGGKAILCQPTRADSLQNFMQLCRSIDGNNSGDGQYPLWKVEWIQEGYDTVVDTKHQESLLCEAYDPNLHYPHLLILTKLRELTAEDRHLAVKQQAWKPKP